MNYQYKAILACWKAMKADTQLTIFSRTCQDAKKPQQKHKSSGGPIIQT